MASTAPHERADTAPSAVLATVTVPGTATRGEYAWNPLGVLMVRHTTGRGWTAWAPVTLVTPQLLANLGYQRTGPVAPNDLARR